MAATLFQPYFKRLCKLLKNDDSADQWRTIEVFEGFREIERKVKRSCHLHGVLAEIKTITRILEVYIMAPVLPMLTAASI